MDKQGNIQSNSAFRFILLLVVIVFSFLLFFIFRTKRQSQQQDTSQVHPTPTIAVENKGAFSLRPAKGNFGGSLANEFDLILEATSDGSPIVGYDIILNYSPDEVELAYAESLLSDFEIYLTDKGDRLILTGAKKLESQTESVFENTPVVQLKVKPKKTGNIVIAIEKASEAEKTQLVDTRTKVLYPETGSITLEITE